MRLFPYIIVCFRRSLSLQVSFERSSLCRSLLHFTFLIVGIVIKLVMGWLLRIYTSDTYLPLLWHAALSPGGWWEGGWWVGGWVGGWVGWWVSYIYIHMYIYTYMYINICICIHTYMYIYIHIHAYIHAYWHMHTNIMIYIYMRTKMNTNMQTYKHSYINTWMQTHIRQTTMKAKWIRESQLLSYICISLVLKIWAFSTRSPLQSGGRLFLIQDLTQYFCHLSSHPLVSGLFCFWFYYSLFHLKWNFWKLFRKLEAKARTSLLPRFSERRPTKLWTSNFERAFENVTPSG